MPLTTGITIALGTAAGLRGTSGEVLNPLQAENLQSLQVLKRVTVSPKTYGGSTTVTNVPEYSTVKYEETLGNCLVHVDQLFHLISAHIGLGTVAAEGTGSYRDTWTGFGAPLPIIALERHGTASATTAKYEYGYLSTFAFGASSPESYVYFNLGFACQKQTLKVANPSLTYKTTTGMPQFSYVTAKKTVLEFTPDGGSLTDYTPFVRTFNFDMSRQVTLMDANLSESLLHAALPDYSPVIVPKLEFTGNVDPVNPSSTVYAIGTGAATGTLPATVSAGCQGTLHLKLLGGLCSGDTSKYFTIDISGTAISDAEINAGNLSGSFQFLSAPTIYIIGDIASVAQPT